MQHELDSREEFAYEFKSSQPARQTSIHKKLIVNITGQNGYVQFDLIFSRSRVRFSFAYDVAFKRKVNTFTKNNFSGAAAAATVDAIFVMSSLAAWKKHRHVCFSKFRCRLCYLVDRQKTSDVKKSVPQKVNNIIKCLTILFCSRGAHLVACLHHIKIKCRQRTFHWKRKLNMSKRVKSETFHVEMEVEALTVDFKYADNGCRCIRCACTFSFDVELTMIMSSSSSSQ